MSFRCPKNETRRRRLATCRRTSTSIACRDMRVRQIIFKSFRSSLWQSTDVCASQVPIRTCSSSVSNHDIRVKRLHRESFLFIIVADSALDYLLIFRRRFTTSEKIAIAYAF